MPKGLDTTVVDLHRVGRTAMDVVAVRGAAWRVRDANDVGTPLTAGLLEVSGGTWRKVVEHVSVPALP